MALITWTDKTDATVSGLPESQKVTAATTAEIKSVVNTNRADHDTLQTSFDTLSEIAGFVPYSYEYDNTTTIADPSAGKFRLNDTAWNSTLYLAISATDFSGRNISDILDLMIVGSFFHIQVRDTTNESTLLEVAAVTNNTSWYEFTVTTSSGYAGLVDDKSLVAMALTPASVGGGSGNVATDAIWDAKGDIALGTGANTASVMSAGANGQFPIYDSAQATGMNKAYLPVKIGVQIGAQDTDLTTGTGKQSFRMPYAMTLTEVQMDVTTAPTGANLIVDINKNAVTMLSTKLSIDASETTSRTATTPAVISVSALAQDDIVSFDIDQIGSTTSGQNLTVWLIGTKDSI